MVLFFFCLFVVIVMYVPEIFRFRCGFLHHSLNIHAHVLVFDCKEFCCGPKKERGENLKLYYLISPLSLLYHSLMLLLLFVFSLVHSIIVIFGLMHWERDEIVMRVVISGISYICRPFAMDLYRLGIL